MDTFCVLTSVIKQKDIAVKRHAKVMFTKVLITSELSLSAYSLNWRYANPR